MNYYYRPIHRLIPESEWKCWDYMQAQYVTWIFLLFTIDIRCNFTIEIVWIGTDSINSCLVSSPSTATTGHFDLISVQ